MSIKYRPEIDGLRAVAVLSVLLCHAHFAGFAGGFVGVDIFFVISGFLITSLIARDLKEDAFSFAGFWERRIRRILPPLVLVVAVSVIAGWFLYLPNDYDLLGKQVASQAIFASNILFKKQAGYFDVSNDTKPLLHTWSLAVEEQFYLLFPLAVFFIWRHRHDKIYKYLAICAAVTFVGASFIVRNSPSSAFYLLPFRAWELLLGSLIALRPKQYPKFTSEIMGFVGLAAIVVAVLTYSKDTLFPGASALLPCLGATAIIASNEGERNIVGRMLVARVPVAIGLISYSLYLWHWPVLVYARYNQLYPVTQIMAAGYLALAVLLAALTWKFVEAPFRRKVILKTRKSAYIAAFICLLTMGGAGLAIHYTGGVPQRLPAEVAQYAAGQDDVNPHRDECNKPRLSRFDSGDICQSNKGSKPTFALWGDSFADAIAPAIYDLSQKYNKNGYIITAHGCPPILDYAQAPDLSYDCIGYNDRALELIEKNNIKTVMLAGNWTGKLRKKSAIFKTTDWYKNYSAQYDDIATAGLKHTVDELQKRGVKVYILTDPPYSEFNPPRRLAMKRLYNAPEAVDTVAAAYYKAGRADNIDLFERLNKQSGIVFIDPAKKLCDDKECRLGADGHSLYFNEGHLSVFGAMYLESLFEGYFRKEF